MNFRLIIILFLVNAFSLNLFAKTKDEAIKQLGLVEGKYEAAPDDKSKTMEGACEVEKLDVKIDDTEKNLTLIIGNNFAFAHLEREGYQTDPINNCVYKFENSIKNNYLKVIETNNCDKKYKVVNELTFKNEKILQKKILAKSETVCTYILKRK